MKKRVFCIALPVILILCLFSGSTFANENSISFVGDSTAEIGDMVVVSLQLDKNPGVISLSFDISYDKEALLLKNVEDARLLNGFNSPASVENVCPYTLFWIDGTALSNNKQTGTVAKLTFEVKKSGKLNITAKCNINDTCNFNLDTVDFGSVTHTIMVNGETPPEDDGGEIPPEDDGGEIPPEDDGGENPPEDDGENSGGSVVVLKKPSVEVTKNINGEVEDTVTLNVDIKNNPGIISAKFYVEYDKEALTLVNVEDTCLLKGSNSSPDYNAVYPYSLFWLEGTASTNNKSNGTIAKLTFKINKAGNHNVKITCQPRNTRNFLFHNIDFGTAAGTVCAKMGERITVNVTEDTDNYLVKVKIKGAETSSLVYVAAYSEKGRMLDVTLADENGKSSFEKSLGISYFKTFLWGANATPLDVSVTTEIN